MGIDFSPERWNRVRRVYGQWWAGELERPLIAVTLRDCATDRSEPSLPACEFASFYDASVTAEAIVDRWDYELSTRRFLGDAFPQVWVNFGPGVVAAFAGCELIAEEGTSWFAPASKHRLCELRFTFDPEAYWFRRIARIMRAAVERWEGRVQVGMTDLGGSLDILSSFRPGALLLLDVYDAPDEVERLTWEIHDTWWSYFEALNEVLQPVNPGYTAWTPIFSSDPYYILQCDFSYMISPEMFDRFVRPELAASCRRLDNVFYHLDGPGQLAHLDSLLSIPQLTGVQWIPGAGQPDESHWPDVYRRIHGAGKRIQLFGRESSRNYRVLDDVAGQIGSARGLLVLADADGSEEDAVHRYLEQYGCDS